MAHIGHGSTVTKTSQPLHKYWSGPSKQRPGPDSASPAPRLPPAAQRRRSTCARATVATPTIIACRSGWGLASSSALPA
eukprot:CAMPEP_0185425418 /NCGR_PEP_ID=MMETSP1365-20130426/13939_1 /TAXON_ID=38817 /ORGANISM="Gephyrocapsa oceanica, Strain RCC1303" /LENGTH=78 /DNA_ID=CAMNT_0028029405 /DNA_START=31 /DNA_END=263 /DNA_ORIENTATION=-